MKQAIITKTLQTLLPMVLGAMGGAAAMAFPAYHIAFCSGVGG